MKRSIFFIILGLLAAGLFAQTGMVRTGRDRTAPELPPVVTVSGNLALINARIGLESGDSTYYVVGIDRLIGFVDGLKEGAPVTLEGYAFPGPEDTDPRYLRVFSMSFNGKDYEVSPRLKLLAEGEAVPRPFPGPELKTWDFQFPGPGGHRRNFRRHFDWR
jgi:hypothetical protein